MKVSIITSCFNREATIGQAIESVLSQDYPDIEYIVVDGASKDGSLQVINRYKDRIAKIISEPDKGMYEGINKGVQAATGDIIGMLFRILCENSVKQGLNWYMATDCSWILSTRTGPCATGLAGTIGNGK